MKNINPLILVNGALVLFMIANGIIKQDLFSNPFRGVIIFFVWLRSCAAIIER